MRLKGDAVQTTQEHLVSCISTVHKGIILEVELISVFRDVMQLQFVDQKMRQRGYTAGVDPTGWISRCQTININRTSLGQCTVYWG